MPTLVVRYLLAAVRWVRVFRLPGRRLPWIVGGYCLVMMMVLALGAWWLNWPQTTITLSQNVQVPSSPGAQPPVALEVKKVTLRLGQVLAVRYQETDWDSRWEQTRVGDTRVVRQAGTPNPLNSCTDRPSRPVGCSSAAEVVYRAWGGGATTITWSLIVGEQNCAHSSRVCSVATQEIVIRVR